MPFDLAFVRRQFPAFAQESLAGQAFFENAGGSYACAPVISRLGEYYRRLKVQPYYAFPASTEAGEWMDASRVRLAEYLGVTPQEVHFGPSTSQNTYVLAQAFRALLKAGDEIIVTNQDHEANSGAWRRLAAHGITVREWRVDPASGMLDESQLDRLISERTRLLTLPHASNVVAHINPIASIAARARRAGVLTVVDGVAWAPHGLPDVAALGADVYLFSLYKTYGPHQGGDAREPAARAQRVRTLLRAAEVPLLETLLAYLATRRDVRLLGPAVAQQRAATVSFVTTAVEPDALVRALAQRGFMAGNGNFYAVRLLEGMQVNPERGAVRLSLLHYNAPGEVAGVIAALDEILGARSGARAAAG